MPAIKYGVRTTVNENPYDGRPSSCPDEAILTVLKQRDQGVTCELYAECGRRIVTTDLFPPESKSDLESIRRRVEMIASRELTDCAA